MLDSSQLINWIGLAGVSPEDLRSPNVEVTFLAREHGADARRLNRALRGCYPSERMAMLKELLSLWRGLGGSPDEFARKYVFGELYKEYGGKELMATMTGNGCQFRLWYAFPGPLGEHHVDGGGTAALLNVSVNPQNDEESRVQEYAKVILEVLGMKFEEALQAPNGAKLWWYVTDKA